MSKFDRPDPSLDRDYTDGLSIGHTVFGPGDPDAPTCFWCGELLTNDATDYCSALCANYALHDDCER